MQANGENGTVWLMEQWTGCLCQVFKSMVEQSPRVAWKAGEGALADAAAECLAQAGELLWWEQPFKGLQGALMWVGTPRQAWEELGRCILNAAGVDDVDPADARGTYVEMLTQVLAGVAGALGGQAGREVLCAKGREAAGVPAPVAFTSIGVSVGDVTVPVLVAWNAAVAAVLPEPEQPGAPAGAESAVAVPSRMLELLLDVELPITVSFGSTQLPLEDVLKLTTGSMVELNRTANEPVHVIVNNCVIARGEVVVIEGNYGIRIKEIISREERLRTLR